MNKKLMLLVAGALTALAFTALPGAASAKQTTVKCEGAGACTYTVEGGISEFSLHGGDTVKCETVEGNGEMTGLNASRETTTGNVRLLFKGCKEQLTIFKFNCQNNGVTGQVTTNTMVTHNVALPGTTPSQSGVLLTDINTSFECAGGFAATTVTGNVIGVAETECNSAASKVQKLEFNKTAHGTQTDRVWTGKTFDLEGLTKGQPKYETAAQTGTGTLTFNQNVKVTCEE